MDSPVDHLPDLFSLGSPNFWFGVTIAAIALFDLSHLHREDEAPRRTAVHAVSWAFVGILYAGAIHSWAGPTLGQEFLAGLLFEKALIVGNVLVIASIAAAFGLRGERERRVLLWGVLGAWTMRILVITASTAFLYLEASATYLLGVVALVAGIVLVQFRTAYSDLAVRAARRLLGRRLPADGDLPSGGWKGSSVTAAITLVAVVEVQVVNLAFAVAASPTIHAVTEDTLVIMASNGVALLGLGPLYFLVKATLLRRFHLLEFGLASLLFVVGAKLLLGSSIPISLEATVSLAFGTIALYAVGSLSQPLGLQHVVQDAPARDANGSASSQRVNGSTPDPH